MNKTIATTWHFGLYYEESTSPSQSYHIYPHDDKADDLVHGETIRINAPKTERNYERVVKIFDTLNDLAEHNNNK